MLACTGTAALSQTLQARGSGGGEIAVFYLADPTDVGFLDAFFPTAGSREASFHGAWMASRSKDAASKDDAFPCHRWREWAAIVRCPEE